MSTVLPNQAIQTKAPEAHAPGLSKTAKKKPATKPIGGVRLFRTSAFRLALLYAILFSALSAATLALIYWSTQSQIRTQVDERLRIESDNLLYLYKSGSVPELLENIQRRNQIDTHGRFYYLENNETASSSEDTTDEDMPIRLKSVLSFSTKTMGDVTDLPPGSEDAFNPVRIAETQLNNGLKLSIGLDISDEQALLDNTFVLVVGATVLTLIFSLISGAWIGMRMVRRIDSVSRTASEIMSGDLSQRLSVTERDDEIDEIATKLNQMLNRIEDLMKSMQQVTNNVAHDLRSPLTRLRNRLEVTLLEERDPESYRAEMESAIGDADSLIQTFNAMLSIARLEAGIDGKQWAKSSIGDLVEELAELYDAVAEDAGMQFSSHIADNPTYYCNRHLIGQAVTNLLDNAIKYSPVSGAISIELSGNDDEFEIVVRDNGPGIPAKDRERVFERFVRLENERNSPGNGLGLSLVQAVMRIHRATLTLEDNEPGLAVRLHFTRQANKGE